KIGDTLRKGWFLITPIIVLLFVLLVLKASANFAAFWAIISVICIGVFNSSHRLNFKRFLTGLEDGARATIQVAVECAGAGIIIGIISLSGLGLKFSSLVIEFSGGSLILTMIMTAIAGIIMGMGMSTTPVYIILSVLV